MNKDTLFKLSGLPGTIDCAYPLEFQKACQNLGIDSAQFVWHYPPDSTFGKPLSIGEMLMASLENGNLMFTENLNDVVSFFLSPDTKESGERTPQDIVKIINQSK